MKIASVIIGAVFVLFFTTEGFAGSSVGVGYAQESWAACPDCPDAKVVEDARSSAYLEFRTEGEVLTVGADIGELTQLAKAGVSLPGPVSVDFGVAAGFSKSPVELDSDESKFVSNRPAVVAGVYLGASWRGVFIDAKRMKASGRYAVERDDENVGVSWRSDAVVYSAGYRWRF